MSNPNDYSWPRKIAIKHKGHRLADALDELLPLVDEANQRFALEEFIAQWVEQSEPSARGRLWAARGTP